MRIKISKRKRTEVENEEGQSEHEKQEKEAVPLNILDLDDKCLVQIFQYLHWQDLLHLHSVHKKFHRAIDCVISDASNNENLALNIYANQDDFYDDMKLIRQYFEMFGSRMKCLKLAVNMRHGAYKEFMMCQKELRELITIYCCKGNIIFLSFKNFLVSKEFLKGIKQLLLALDSLELCNSITNRNIRVWMKFVVACKKLKTIRFTTGDVYDLDFNLFGSIAKSQLETCQMNLQIKSCTKVDTFLPNHTLKYLNLGCYAYDPAILISFPHIEHLKYQIGQYSLQPIWRLTQLKKLELHGKLTPESLLLLRKFARRNNLELFSHQEDEKTVYLKDEQIELFANILPKMTNLRELKIFMDSTSVLYLHRLAHNLGNLHKAHFNVTHETELMVVTQMLLDFVKLTAKLTHLSLSLQGDGGYYQTLYNDIVVTRQLCGFNKVLRLKFFGCDEDAITSSEEQRKFVCYESKFVLCAFWISICN